MRIRTIESGTQTNHDSKPFRVYSQDGKAVTLQGAAGGYGAKTGLYAVPVNPSELAGWGAAYLITFDADGQMTAEIDGRVRVIYEVRDGRITIKGERYQVNLADGFYIIRKLTVTECKRLQTVPDDYVFPVSDTQAYKMLGNGWTVDVIAHILSYCPGITAEPLEVLSMYDGMSCGRLALNKLGAHIGHYYATEIDKYAIKTTQHNFPDTIQLGDAFQVRDDEWRVPWLDIEKQKQNRKTAHLKIAPITLREANKYVAQYHRHNKPTNGHKWSVACYDGDRLCGVAIAGHPIARKLDDGLTVEIRRVCTDGTYNACSMLYGACARIARDMGYKRVITYTLISESGTSLKASGFKNCGEAGGVSWNVPSRPREVEQITLFGTERKYQDEKKIRWERRYT